ncbi:unnamed protein product, partial [marine sediment metagenome]
SIATRIEPIEITINPYTVMLVIELSSTDSNLLISVKATRIMVMYAEYVKGSSCCTIKKNHIQYQMHMPKRA